MKYDRRLLGLAVIMASLMVGSLLTGCRSEKPNVPPGNANRAAPTVDYVFDEVTNTSNIRATYDNSERLNAYSIVESLGGGLGVFDFDNDGREDLWFPGGGRIDPQARTITGLDSWLYRRTAMNRLGLPHQLSEPGVEYTEVGDRARLTTPTAFTHGCSLGDLNNDGFEDALVTGYGGLQLFINLGDGTFVECAQSVGLTETSWSSSSAMADINGDGALDLYIVHYVDWSWDNDPKCESPPPQSQQDVCTPTKFKGLDDAVYLSDGAGGFYDATGQLGLVPQGKGLGVVAADLDLDGDIEIYVANDTTENFLYINQGTGPLKEAGLISGAALDQRGTPNGSMGLAVLDYDSDLKPDIWVTNFENETFSMYRGQGDANFMCVTESTGITAIGTLYVGFGTQAFDVELDGDQDLVVSNGHVQRFPGASTTAQQPLLLLGNGRGRLQRWTPTAGGYFAGQHRGRSVVATDLDSDGLLDLIFSHVQEPASILLNRTEPRGTWVGLRLIGTHANRNAVGASVELSVGQHKQIRQIVGGGGYLSQSPYTLHFGIPRRVDGTADLVDGATTAATALVRWPGGKTQSYGGLQLGQVHQIVQPH